MSQVFEIKKNKVFSLVEARELLPIIQRVTQDSLEKVEMIKHHIQHYDLDSFQRQVYEDQAADIVSRWSEKVVKLGCEPKGLWLVDFNNGEGFYCWKHPEPDISYFHPYEGGFQGRTPIL